MRVFALLGVTALLLFGFAEDAQAGPIVPYAGNGHSYQLIIRDYRLTWLEAQAEAAALGGHLATLNDAGEGAFVKAMLEPAAFAPWFSSNTFKAGPYLGGVNVGGTWTWQDGTGDTFPPSGPGYADWLGGEPNGQTHLLYFQIGPMQNGWADHLPNTPQRGRSRAFFVEYPIPEPTTLAMFAAGAGAFCLIRRRRRSA